MFTWKHKYHFDIEGPKLEVGVGGGGGGTPLLFLF